MTWNGLFHLICNFSNLFTLKQLRMTQNNQFCLIYNFSNLFPSKQTRMTWNGQFHLICNFSNFFPLKWLRMTRNSQFTHFATFPIFSPKVARNDWEWPILPDSQLFQCKKDPLSHQKMKCSFLDYVQLLMIG